MLLLRMVSFIGHNLFSVSLGLLGIGFVIGFHELGHFLFCKLFNVRTPSFSIGIGPRIFSKRIGDTDFALSAIPVGGYVEVAGSAEVGQGDQKDAHARDERSFAVKPYYQKFLILMGGILFNMGFAYFALILLFMIGLPKTSLLYPRNASSVIKEVVQDSPASKAGLHVGDRLIAIDGQNFNGDVLKAHSLIADIPDKETSIVVERDGQEMTLPVTFGSRTSNDGKAAGVLGVNFEVTGTSGLPFIQAVTQGIDLTNRYILGTVRALKNLFVTRDTSQVGGPIMVISQIVQSASDGLSVFLLILALVSVNLAVLNLIPLPILDGGQLLYHTIEAIIGRPIPGKIREYIHMGTWIFMLALILYLSAKDIFKMIQPWIATFSGK